MASAGTPAERSEPVGPANEQPSKTYRRRGGHLPSTFTFTDLPFSVCRRVYILLGLPTQEYVSLNAIPKAVAAHIQPSVSQDELGVLPRACDLYDKNDDQRGAVLTLLRVSRTLCEEVREIFSSENAIVVSQHRWGGLRALEDIGPGGWRNLREVVVRLEPCRCSTPFCAKEGWVAGNQQSELCQELSDFLAWGPLADLHYRLLSEANENDRDYLLQWDRICAGIAAHGRPDRLRILFAGATVELETGEGWLLYNSDADTGVDCAPREFLHALRRCAATDSLRHVRRLRLVFPTFGPTYLTPSRRSWQLWLEVVEVLAAWADLPKLVLTVSFFLQYDSQEGIQYQVDRMGAFVQIVRCLKRISALKGLRIWVIGTARE